MKNTMKVLALLMVMIIAMISCVAFAEEPVVSEEVTPVVEEPIVEEPVVEEPVVEEPVVEEPVVEEPVVEEPVVEEEPVAFIGTVEIELVNTEELYYGDIVTLRAVITDANTEYAIRWEVRGDGDWTEIPDETEEEYSFELTEETAGLEYRVVLITEA